MCDLAFKYLITSKYPNNVRHFSKKNFFFKSAYGFEEFQFFIEWGWFTLLMCEMSAIVQ